MQSIEISALDSFIDKIGKEWFLVSAFKDGKANSMTCSWGTIGFIWRMPIFTVLVRDSRYTKEFIDSTDRFSVSFFDSSKKPMLAHFGKVSGRDEDKFAGFDMTVDSIDDAPAFNNATLTIVCRKVFASRLSDEQFIDRSILDSYYPTRDMHTLYAGEILSAYTG